MKIYTKTGDVGETSLFGGRRVLKNELKIECYGTVDELNSWVGLVRDVLVNVSDRETLIHVQDRLFVIGAILATDSQKENLKTPAISEEDVKYLETAIDNIDSTLEPLKNFVLPGGHLYVSYCHIARTVCRRAERLVVSLNQVQKIPLIIIKYLNRLSDYLFTLSRKLSKDLNAQEVIWTPRN